MTPCIEAPGKRSKDGYVWQKRCGQRFLAHRHAYCQHHGIVMEAIAGKVVRHKCDNPPCINPEHLELGTHRDNVADKVARNRQPKGELIPSAKLRRGQVVSARVWLGYGISVAEVARRLQVSHTTISRIKRGITWRHVQ